MSSSIALILWEFQQQSAGVLELSSLSFETLDKTKDFSTTKNLSNPRGIIMTKRYELHLQTALHLSSKNFRPLQKTLKLSGVCLNSSHYVRY